MADNPKEEKGAEQPKEAAAPKKKNKKVLFGVAGGGVLIVVVGVVLFLTGVVGGSAAPVDDKAQLELDLPNKPRPTVALKEFVVNLADQEPRYLKATVQLEVANEKVAAACEANMAAIRNSLVELLSSKAYLQIRDVRGKTKLREEVIVRLNEILGANGITQVYFTDFIVQ